jgi:hypothetical protein
MSVRPATGGPSPDGTFVKADLLESKPEGPPGGGASLPTYKEGQS